MDMKSVGVRMIERETFHSNSAFIKPYLRHQNKCLQVAYLLFELSAVGMESITDGADVMCAEGCNIVEKLWADKIHHTPVFLKAVLEWIARKDDSCSTLDLLCGHRELRL